MTELAYELRNDAVLYTLGGGLRIKVQRKSPARVRVTMQRDEVIVPPETGDLGTSGFRNRLVELARERLGEVAGLADDLGLIAVGFEEHLKERDEVAAKDDEQTNAPELVGTPYRIVDGGFVYVKNTREGELPQRITNFTAWVEEELIRDDGAEAKRVYRLAGEARGKPLPKVDVPAAQFGAMNWTSDKWGLSAGITAGPGARDCTREAIELYSSGAATRYLYVHTGWRELPGGQLAYLHAAGALGADGVGVEVELEPGLERYALPPSGTSEELAEAVRQSLSILTLAPMRITAPLLAAAYLAPLCQIIVAAFVVWLWGPTGALKSTLAALVLSHYGNFSETQLPLSFESTANALERHLFLLKDILAVVDDFRPAVSRSEASEMDRKAQRLLRGMGNRTGRGRMTSDTMLRHTYAPRGMVVATAETLPEGPAFESAAARALSLNLSPNDVSLQRLSQLQQCKKALSQGMTGYLEWLVPLYEDLSSELPVRRDALRDELRAELVGAHPKTPEAVASLIVALQVLKDFAVDSGAFDAEEGDEFLKRATAGVIEAGQAHADTTRGGDPAIIRNFFAPSFLGDVHYIVGNPPWVNWENLPESYRDSIKKYWSTYAYNLFRHKGLAARLGSAHDDICVLLTYIVADVFLRTGGKLGFVLPQTLFKSKGGGEGFRSFSIKDEFDLKVIGVDDLIDVKPFEASNKPAVFAAIKGEKTQYPVPYTRWARPRGTKIASVSDLSTVKSVCTLSEEVAVPIDVRESTSPWVTGEEDSIKALLSIVGKSPYRARKGVVSA